MEVNIPSELSSTEFSSPIPPGHTEEDPSAFQCRICGQIFTNQADLIEHMAVVHKQEADSTAVPPKTDANPPAGVG